MIHAVKTLNDQALKAYNNLLSLFDKVDTSIKTKLSLFDATVVPILRYCSEVWAFIILKTLIKFISVSARTL